MEGAAEAEGSVERHPSEGTDAWGGPESELLVCWDDGTGGGRVELAEFLAMAGPPWRWTPTVTTCDRTARVPSKDSSSPGAEG
ncbi:hypothetical protein ACFWJM_02170 [Streptomyces sp. NPDC127077]|uniref:hypothetical protein n=1 Tax=Streptomyces sp. NPDC127077 TaxID=3347131 RepID=UPI003651AA53